MFFPYQIDIDLNGRPYLTYFICLVCVLVFFHQEYSYNKYAENITKFCEGQADGKFRSMLQVVVHDKELSCEAFVDGLFFSGLSANEYVKSFLKKTDSIDAKVAADLLISISESAKEKIQPHVTQEWAFIPGDENYMRMFTSSVSHADWEHLAFNLVFFFAFASSAELVMGPIFFIAVFLFSCLSTSIAYSYGAFGFDNTLPTIGLSGVVTSYMAAMALLFPHKMVRMFYWIIFLFGVFRVPLLIVVSIYIGLDIYGLEILYDNSRTNYLSHIAGSASGAFLGLVYLGLYSKKLQKYY